ncbi:universal stress protein UspA [Corynebacterium sp. 13CS0277]|uniref:universal stress protein n=1 Tax=Corynebacterium sp. 13CS0277 TaxID=2071994 RepID=UPI000D02B6F9|nr:universal stress protein [Corynebacterium sp. 13CS0277]PRQ10694.1 universal stress protein UspA [Corynebacterium sp. 13CS0277]
MRCLIGYEATPQGLDALGVGIDLARATGAELDIVVVLRRHNAFSHEYPPSGRIDDILVSQAFGWLREAMAIVPDDVDARGVVLSDTNTAEGLIRAADSRGGDIIVVGGASASPLKRHTLGSVATDLLLAAPVPVALAPRGYRRGPLHRINAAVGTRPGTVPLVRASLAVAAQAGLPLRLVALPGHAHGRATAAAALEHAEGALAEAQSQVPEASTNTTVDVAPTDDINAAVEAITVADGDVFFVGSSRVEHSRHLFSRAIAMRLLKNLDCPIVVVPTEYAGLRHIDPGGSPEVTP